MKQATTLVRRTAAILLAAWLTLTLLSSCGGTAPPAGIHTTRVVSSFDIGELGNNLYTSYFSVIYRYNRASGEFSRACLDPECGGTCPLESGYCRVVHIGDGRLYFFAWMIHERDLPCRYGYQDLVTGEITVLAEVPQEEADEGTPVFVYDGMMYYTRKTLKEEAERDGSYTAEDWVKHLCRVPVDGGEEERLRSAPGEIFFMIADGYYITYSAAEGILSYDRDFRDRTALLSFAQQDLRIQSQPQYLDGKLYCTIASGADPRPYLYSLDLATGEMTKLFDTPAYYNFQLTDDAIWYLDYDVRVMYKPEGWDEMTEEEQDEISLSYCPHGTTLYTCDPDGKNARAVYTNETLEFYESFTVIDGVLYGWMRNFDDETHTWGKPFFGKIDLASGTITPATPTES